MHSIAHTTDLRAHYVAEGGGGRRTVRAVDGVTLAIRENEVLGIAGESGCGKSTLLKALLGAVTPPLAIVGGAVTYHVDGQDLDVFSLPERRRRSLRWQFVSYIPQGSMHVLNPVRRIRNTFRDFIGVHRRVRAAQADDLARGYLRDLGLQERVLDAFPHQLSGGMRQRVTIALATILSPRLVLADEPTTALDVVMQRGVIQMLDESRRRAGSTLVVVTHDMGVHANLAHRVAVLYAGQLVEEADTEIVFTAPRHPYTRHLIQSLPKMGDKTERLSIPGQPPALDDPPAGCRFHPRCPHAMSICKAQVPPLTQISPRHKVACFLVSDGESGDTPS